MTTNFTHIFSASQLILVFFIAQFLIDLMTCAQYLGSPLYNIFVQNCVQCIRNSEVDKIFKLEHLKLIEFSLTSHILGERTRTKSKTCKFSFSAERICFTNIHVYTFFHRCVNVVVVTGWTTTFKPTPLSHL